MRYAKCPDCGTQLEVRCSIPDPRITVTRAKQRAPETTEALADRVLTYLTHTSPQRLSERDIYRTLRVSCAEVATALEDLVTAGKARIVEWRGGRPLYAVTLPAAPKSGESVPQ